MALRASIAAALATLALALLASAQEADSDPTEKIAETLDDIIPELKQRAARFYLSTHTIPDSMSDYDMHPTTFMSRVVRRVDVFPSGEVVFTLTDLSGVTRGTVTLRVEAASERALGLRWWCETQDFERLPRYLPACFYRPRD